MNRYAYLEAGYKEIQHLPIGQRCLYKMESCRVIEGFCVKCEDGTVVSMAADTLILPLNF